MELSERNPAVAGLFYPEQKNKLKEMLSKLFKTSKNAFLNGSLKGLVFPHAGYIYSGLVMATAAKLLQKEKPKKVIVFGPSHFVSIFGAKASGFDFWVTPLTKTRIEKQGVFQVDDLAHEREHSVEVILPFLQFSLKKFRFLPLVYGEENYKDFAEKLSLFEEKKTVFIASSDLSHYHSYNAAIAIDSVSNKAVPELNFDLFEFSSEACGKTGVLALMYLAKMFGWKGNFIDYMNSGDTAGSKDEVVGYACYAFEEVVGQ